MEEAVRSPERARLRSNHWEGIRTILINFTYQFEPSPPDVFVRSRGLVQSAECWEYLGVKCHGGWDGRHEVAVSHTVPDLAAVVFPDYERIVFGAFSNLVAVVPHPPSIKGVAVHYSVPCWVGLLDHYHVSRGPGVLVKGVGKHISVALKGLPASHESCEVGIDVGPDSTHFFGLPVPCLNEVVGLRMRKRQRRVFKAA